ncbi:MAG TPA: NADH dehydrogenase (quinone) subunit D [Bryobacteraceae bacterium]|nr:NADH dehydrogenase (quinone) subunit D [Bryobacteraceae bacterium]
MSDSDLKSTTATLETTPEEIEKSSASERRRMTLNMGPQHPSTHGVLRVLLELDGETVMRAYPDIGFLHTGIEKQCEALTWQQVVPLTDRVDYLNNMGNNLVYALAVEKLLNVTEEMPEAVKMMRVLLAELQRINSHCVWLGTHALDIGAMTVFFYCFREREDILRLFEMISGQRMMTSYIRPGGLALEPPRGWFKSARKFIDAFSDKVDEYENLLAKNPIWLQRTQGVGHVSLDELLDWGVTGPMIRAAGVPWDIRKDEPYSGYEKYNFDVATRTENDVWARYRVRMQEMRESAKIVKQALDGIPDGPWQLDIPRVTLPGREKMKTQMEALIHHFKIVTEGMRVPAGEAYQAVESPRGEIAYYVVSDGSSHPHRVFMRTPSFGNLQVLPPMVEGKLIADTIAAMGSMDFVLGDVDR